MLKRILVLVLLLGVGLFSQVSHADVNTGETAPDFTLNDTNGQAHSLSQYKGKYVVLEWFNHDCPFVKKHYDQGHMQALQREYTDKDVVWLAVNSSAEGKEGYYPADKLNEISQEKGTAATAVFIDADGTVGKLYGAKTTPHMYVISPQGLLIYQGAIDDKASADTADIASSVNYVKAALDEAIAGKAVTQASTKAYGCSVKY